MQRPYRKMFLKLHWSIAAKSLLVGIVSGILVALYRVGIDCSLGLAHSIYGTAAEDPVRTVVLILAAIAIGLLIYRMLEWEPMAGGSGIPQTEGVLSYVLKMRWWSILVVRYAAGMLGSLFGLSLGREGPSVQIGAAGGQAVRKAIGHGGLEENCLITAGAAAGLSAAFSAPLSGLVFALEEVHRSFSPFLLIAAATATIAADAVASIAFGLQPVLDFGAIAEIPLADYLWMPALGILCGLLGTLTNRALAAAQKLYGRIPAPLCPIIALVIAVPVGIFIPDIIGGGQNLIAMAESARSGIAALLILLIAKMLFTCSSFGSNTPGGIFMPVLAIGALGGAAFGLTLSSLGLISADYVPEFAICGMAGAFTACIKAPITGILLTVEMTGSLAHVLPVALAAFTALFVADLLRTSPIYNTLLDRYIDLHGRFQGEKDPERLFEVSIRKGSTLEGCEVGQIDWPKTSILVSIHKAERTVVPRDTTRIRSGDHLIVTPRGNRAQAKKELSAFVSPLRPS